MDRQQQQQMVPLMLKSDFIGYTVEPFGTDTSVLRTVSNVPTKFSYIFFNKNLYNTDSL